MRSTNILTNERIFACVLAASLFAALPVFADNTPNIDPLALTGDPVPPPDGNAPDKSGYNLFKPTPDDQMRQFSADRPGKTHSSTTVDAGHFQLESDFYNYTYDYTSPQQQTTRAYSIATPVLKFGITNWADLEAAFALYNQSRVTDRAAGSTIKGTGFGDISLGGKFNIFGNDGGDQALALQPFIKIPTAATNIGNGVVEYTLNVPYTVDLDTLWSMTAEPEFGLLKDANDSGLHGDYAFIVNVNRPVFIKELTAALEFASDYSSDPNIGPRYTLDPSLQWLVMPAMQLDVGVYIGLNRATPDYQAYSGISFRI